MKKLRINYLGLSFLFFIIVFVCYVFTSLFIKSYNNDLTIKIQQTKSEIEIKVHDNNGLRTSIQSLSTSDRVLKIAEENDLVLNQDNIISINNNN